MGPHAPTPPLRTLEVLNPLVGVALDRRQKGETEEKGEGEEGKGRRQL